MPVTRLDGASVGHGEVGPLTQQLQRMYWQRAADDPRNTPVPYENMAAARGGKELA